MKYFLDTNALIDILNSNKKLRQVAFNHFCDVFGIVYQTRCSLEIAAKNYALLRKTGTPIEDGDLLIGSLAIAENAVLVTNNTKHLSRLQDIQLENWAE